MSNHFNNSLTFADCSYHDIKCNVLIEHNNVLLIGQIQFIFKFMLETKKKQHKIYGLLRKQDLFQQLNKIY